MKLRILRLASAVLLAAAAALVPALPASAAPTFKVPFPCNQSWYGQTRTNHSPAYAIDFNRTDDLGDPVVASAPGTVDIVRDLGGTSYGKYVRVNHGSGYTTYYAHLNSFSATVGESVSYGEVIGYVGSTGNSSGPHLHYEQRYNGNDIQIRFNGVLAYYWGSKLYTSDNGCSGGGYTATVNTSGANLNVRSGPSTSYSIVGTVADGQTVTITCQTTGQSITGTYGTSNIWNRIASPSGYIADAYTYTGYDGFVPGVPRC